MKSMSNVSTKICKSVIGFKKLPIYRQGIGVKQYPYVENIIRGGGSTALYTTYAVYTVSCLQTAFQCLNSSMYGMPICK